MAINQAFWCGKRVFLTGHTGFKGSWLSLWLKSLGANLHGFALEPSTKPSLFVASNLNNDMVGTIGDIRDLKALTLAMANFNPDIVIHMAAQALVRQSYISPVETYATNVMGTVHLLDAVRHVPSVRVVVNVTTDKCYENKEWVWGYREDEPMGGYDPYSNSKGCAELVTSAYRRSFFNDGRVALASARAGNVIGGGDWAPDRLIPDILKAFEYQLPASIRNPHAIRPWQHVLEPLSGYLTLAEHLWESGMPFAEGWNFGPHDEDARPVSWIAEHLASNWGGGASWQTDGRTHPHEAQYLKLDISKARSRLNWQPRWRLPYALDQIIRWHQSWVNHEDVKQLCLVQIEEYTHSMNTPSTMNAEPV